MGGLILTLSLKDLIADPTMIVHVDKIFQIILGAPDIDQKNSVTHYYQRSKVGNAGLVCFRS
ncbi:hypothetical protein CS542_08895 [Pedobacter sp. IW39]|nr:hypothetical protein CS542_08895 [Pedobacter sp. IW39]